MGPFGFLFDNDGVLIDSSHFHWQAWQLLMREEPDLKMEQKYFIHTFGKRNDLILQELIPQASEEVRRRWAKRKEELFRQLVRGKIQLLPGMENFLKEVKKANIARIIASSTPLENLELYIESTVLGHYFEQYLSAEQLAHGKPFPDIFLAASKALGLPSKDCIVFEDAPSGIQAGKAAGCFVVALATTHAKEQLDGYDMLFQSPHDLNLPAILQAFNKWRHQETSH